MAGAEYPGAIWIPSPHFNSRGGMRASWIIIHGTAGFSSAQDVAYFFQTPQNGNPTSVHYIVGRDGSVVQSVSESQMAWGNGVLSAGHAAFWNPNINPNLTTLSIEHVKPDIHNATPLTSAQTAASFRLVAYLCAKYQIPHHAADATGGITGHFSIDPVNRSYCPGVYPWAALFSYLGSPAAALNPGISIGPSITEGGPNSGGGMIPGIGGGTGPASSGDLSPAGALVGGIQDAILSATGTLARAPVSPGVLGFVELLDEWEQYPSFSVVDWLEPQNWVPFVATSAEATIVRGLVVLVGLMLVLIVMFNVQKQMVEHEAEVLGPVIRAAATGAL